MNTIFADSLYWIALTNPKDQWHQKAVDARDQMHPARLITTEAVLVEVLTYFGAYGRNLRRTAARVVRTILGRSDVDVVPHTHKLFMAGLALYEARLDKSYSMADCMSMHLMRRRGLTEVLTHDDHFAQEGFTVLL